MLAGTSEPTPLWIRVSRTASHTATVIEILGEYTLLHHTTAVQLLQQQGLQAHTLAQLPPVPRIHPGFETFLSSLGTEVSDADWTVDIPYAYHAIGNNSTSSSSSSGGFTVAALSQLTLQNTSDSAGSSASSSTCSWKWVVAHRHSDAVSTDCSSSSSDTINRCTVAVQDVLSVHNHSDVDMYVALQSADVSRYVLVLNLSCDACFHIALYYCSCFRTSLLARPF
jgi:hypothetical protein